LLGSNLLLAGRGAAQTYDQLEVAVLAASKIKDPKLRLKQFDELAKTVARIAKNRDTKASRGVIANSIGNWETEVSTSRFDDSKSVYASLQAIRRGDDDREIRRTQPTLHFRMLEGNFSILFLADCRFKRDSRAIECSPVRYRLDSEGAVDDVLRLSTSGKALFWHDGAKQFAAQLAKSKKMLFKFSPAGRPSVVAEFDTSRALEALKWFSKEAGVALSLPEKNTEQKETEPAEGDGKPAGTGKQ